MMESRHAIVVASLWLIAAALPTSGCARATPYRPDREVVRSIPADRARQAIRELLGRATAHAYFGALEATHVDESGFGYAPPEPIEGHYRHDPPEYRQAFRYDEVDPRIHVFESRVFVYLHGEFDGVGSPGSLANPCDARVGAIWFSSTEDAEMFVDAVGSLSSPEADDASDGGARSR